MKDRPILMSAPMVRATLREVDPKTQTRRIAPILDLNIKPNSNDIVTWGVSFSRPVKGVLGSYSGGKFSDLQARSIIASQFCPYGQPGDRLWVRETFAHFERNDTLKQGDRIYYRADGDCIDLQPWRPSIHMPRWASRITLEITGVRVERLQDISEADSIAEGIEVLHASSLGPERYLVPASGREPAAWAPQAKIAYRELWEQINGPGSWDANPYVWVIEFRRIKP